MSQYKELADAIDNVCEDGDQRDQIAAILRSLDAQEPIGYINELDEVVRFPTRKPWLTPDKDYERAVAYAKSEWAGRLVYAAPVAAQPTDQSVTPEYLSWLASVQPRAGVGGNEAWNAGVAWAKAAQPQQAKPLSDAQPRLRVRIRSFPESNGRRNWTALLCREDENFDGLVGNCGGIQIARGELWNRVAYHAEEARFLIGERGTEPHILDYGDDIETPEQWAGEVRNGIKEQG